jgi:hypothetical protein
VRCPLFSPIQAVEGPLLNDLLREHPEAQAAAIVIPVGTAMLARRPTSLLALYLGLLVLALGSSLPVDRGSGSAGMSSASERR